LLLDAPVGIAEPPDADDCVGASATLARSLLTSALRMGAV
jgi:hypothetical protein